jgi:antibiotic biosynthesis monooxygenase (ABM) superfamily enzyme
LTAHAIVFIGFRNLFNLTLRDLLESFQPKEVSMVAKIIIKRRFVDGKSKQIIALLNEIRSKAMNYPGYMSGETLSKKEFPLNMAVISTWQTMEDWLRWKESPERKKYEEMLEIFQTRPTEYEEYILGTSFQK